MSDVYAARRDLLRDRCAAAGNAAALITRPANVRYLSGASPLGAVLLVGPTEDMLFCAGAPTGEADEGRLDEHLNASVLGSPGGDPAVAAADLAAALRADSLAVEEHHLTVARHRALRSVAPKLRLADLGTAVEQQRLVKDEEEIACLRIAAEIADQASGSCWSPSSWGAPSGTWPWSWSAARRPRGGRPGLPDLRRHRPALRPLPAPALRPQGGGG